MKLAVRMIEREAIERFDCFAGRCAVIVQGAGGAGPAGAAAHAARRFLEECHQRFSRFEAASELTRLNADRRETVPVSPAMARFALAAVNAARLTGGLVDPTLIRPLEAAGYAGDRRTPPVPLAEALAAAPARRPARPATACRWAEVRVDLGAGTITRPPGVMLDSGGIAKGLFGDLLAERLAGHASFALDIAGDVRLGGESGLPRPVDVASPFDGSVLHTFEPADGAAATSGIGRRSWWGPHGVPRHHLLDPSTGAPAFTGVVQATALAPTGVEAEALSKAALLSGPVRGREWLVHGGLLVLDDGTLTVVSPR